MYNIHNYIYIYVPDWAYIILFVQYFGEVKSPILDIEKQQNWLQTYPKTQRMASLI